MKKITKEDLERMIIVAKEVLTENPDDTWVEKGLREMQKEVRRMDEEKLRMK
jgi:hypothetical protein